MAYEQPLVITEIRFILYQHKSQLRHRWFLRCLVDCHLLLGNLVYVKFHDNRPINKAFKDAQILFATFGNIWLRGDTKEKLQK